MAMGLITPKTVAEKLAAHLQHKLSLDSLVAWADLAMMDGEFDPAHLPTVRDCGENRRRRRTRIRPHLGRLRATPFPTRLFRASQHRCSIDCCDPFWHARAPILERK